MDTPTVTLSDIQAARERIQPYVRRTPMVMAAQLKNPAYDGRLSLKLESLQVTGSFKARGAVNKLRTLSPDQLERGIVTASGGNHGKAVAYAGWLAHKPATVYLPTTTLEEKAAAIREWGANVVMEGDVFDAANAAALARAAREGMAYIHPFDDPTVIAGQGTITLEILEDLPDVDTLFVAIGGGGLISGISVAARALKPSLRVIGVEAEGAPSIKLGIAAGHLVELSEVKTAVGTLAPRRTGQINFDIIRRNVDDIVLVSDDDMAQASRWLWSEMGIAAELSGAAALAALLCGKVPSTGLGSVCVLVCGAGLEWMGS
jgi:threonine dehydratase